MCVFFPFFQLVVVVAVILRHLLKNVFLFSECHCRALLCPFMTTTGRRHFSLPDMVLCLVVETVLSVGDSPLSKWRVGHFSLSCQSPPSPSPSREQWDCEAFSYICRFLSSWSASPPPHSFLINNKIQTLGNFPLFCSCRRFFHRRLRWAVSRG